MKLKFFSSLWILQNALYHIKGINSEYMLKFFITIISEIDGIFIIFPLYLFSFHVISKDLKNRYFKPVIYTITLFDHSDLRFIFPDSCWHCI